jgi:bacillithiol system protein YtxJ
MILDLLEDHDFEQLMERSKTNPILIFKHSTQCGISAQAYECLTDFEKGSSETFCGVVLVIENRELSDAIAERFHVRHESPQALLIKDGRPVWHASHWSITSESLSDALRSHAESPHQRN